jgi:hypothetical protein
MGVKQKISRRGEACLSPTKFTIYCVSFLLLFLSGCGINRQPSVVKIALLAPFEGRYREIGYDALYAARLAIADSGYDHIDLLAIDDGGSVDSAINRAHAIQVDPQIALTLVLGLQVTASEVQTAFGQHPVVIVGQWYTQPAGENVVMLASREIAPRLSQPQPTTITSLTGQSFPIIGSELFALKQMPMLYDDLIGITILSSASLPDEDFTQRYLASDSFVPQPGLLSTLTYDATRLAIESIVKTTPLREIQYEGINGTITFDSDGYWQAAPIYEYTYESGELAIKP